MMHSRTFLVAPAEAGKTLSQFLRQRLGLPVPRVGELLRKHGVEVNGAVCKEADRRLRRGQRVVVHTNAPASGRACPRRTSHPSRKTTRRGQAPPLAKPVLRYSDDHVVVVDKPAGLTTVRHAHEAEEFGERGKHYLPQTLADMLPGLLAAKRKRSRVRAVHRLDKETSGLIVFALTPEAERHLGNQFRARTTARTYLALVRGRARPGRIESLFVEDRGDRRRGSRPDAPDGKRAVTHVRVVEVLGDFTLVECTLETGRTHQVRIHLGEAGTPLCGERVYDRPLHGQPLPDASGAGRPMLHAATLGFDHPVTGKRMIFDAPMPKDMQELLKKLRRGRG